MFGLGGREAGYQEDGKRWEKDRVACWNGGWVCGERGDIEGLEEVDTSVYGL